MLDFLDFFKVSFQFNLNGHKSFNTLFSLLNSILVLIIIIFYSIWNLNGMFQYQELSINSYTTLISQKDMFRIKDTHFVAAINILDRMGNSINSNKSPLSNYINFNAAVVNPDVNHQFSFLPIDFIKCNTSILTIDTNPYLLCLNFKDYLIGGSFLDRQIGNKNYSFLEFNITSNFSADTNPQIYQLFPITVMLVTESVTYDLDNYSVPFLIDSQTALFQFFPNYTLQYNCPLTLDQLHTDSSFTGKSNKIDYILTTKGNIFTQTQIPSSTLAIIDVYIDPQTNLYFRKYKKIQGVLNDVSSVSNILFLVLGIISRWYNMNVMKINFIEENLAYKNEKNPESIEVNPVSLIPLVNPENIEAPENINQINLQNIKPEINLESKNPLAIPENINSLFNAERNQVINPMSFYRTKIRNQFVRKRRNLTKMIDNRCSLPITLTDYFYYAICGKMRNKSKLENPFNYTIISEFYESLIDIKRILVSLSHFEDMKNLKLGNYQNILLSRSKIVVDCEEIKKSKAIGDREIQKSLNILRRKVNKNKFNDNDFMILNKY